MHMLKTIYDLFIGFHDSNEDGSMTVYQNEFYALTVNQDSNKVITSAIVENITKDEGLPTVDVYYNEGWKYNITYPQLSMSVDKYEGVGSTYVSNCQHGQVSAQAIVDKLNELEEIVMMEYQMEMMENTIREEILFEIQNPIEGEDCSHWRDKPWSPKKHYV